MSLLAWVLLEADRDRLAGLLVAATFLGLALAGWLGVLELARPQAADTIAGGLVPGLFAFLSIVLAINQLVLSQEFGSAAEIRDRIDRVRAFREDVERTAGQAPSPVQPTDFLRLIVATIADIADGLEPGPDTPDAVRGQLAAFAADVGEAAGQARAELAGSEVGRISAILAVLDYPDADQMQRARLLVDRHEASLPRATVERLDRLVEALELFGVARTHFRTSYTQRVLARLSRQLLAVGVPAILAAFALALLPPPWSAELRVAVAAGLLSLAFTPVAVLSSYVLRIATVSERTLAAGPFLSRP